MRPLLNIQRDPFAQLQGFVTRSFDSCVGWYIINSKNPTRTSDYFTKHLLNLYPGSCIVIYPVELRDGHVWRENECGMLETKKRVRKRAHSIFQYERKMPRRSFQKDKRTSAETIPIPKESLIPVPWPFWHILEELEPELETEES